MTHVVLGRQSIFDVAVIRCGAAEEAYAIAYANSIAPSAYLSTGQELTITAVSLPRVVKFFGHQTHVPATGTDNPMSP
jgi:hypothetical protein